ncbi:hypothetical protein ABZX93_02565 [Streptomyces sp. NPDC006632]|uniref:hypothetical protein n=1 Tax=unclassified Streptomyces TaxID=2593676 RepID=UPI002E224BA8
MNFNQTMVQRITAGLALALAIAFGTQVSAGTAFASTAQQSGGATPDDSNWTAIHAGAPSGVNTEDDSNWT